MTKKYINDVLSILEKSNQKIYKSADLSDIFSDLMDQGKLPKGLSVANFINKILDNTDLREVNLPFPNRTEKRYVLNDYSIYGLAISLRKGAYFSHLSAAYLNGFLSESPREIYINYEQTPKPLPKQTLVQENIDKAYKNSPRETKTKVNFENYAISILNGKYTNQLGVINIPTPQGEILRVTDVNRTLIDLVVRPIYSGGVANVIRIYKKASNSLSIPKLIDLLSKLKYIYPYHQNLGFYLERTGVFKKKDLECIKKIGIEYEFYLTHDIQKLKYSSEWHIYYPEELDSE